MLSRLILRRVSQFLCLAGIVIYLALPAHLTALAATETPYPTPDVTNLPSEAGQNYGLIGGAAFLVLIVIVGVLWHRRQHQAPPPKSG